MKNFLLMLKEFGLPTMSAWSDEKMLIGNAVSWSESDSEEEDPLGPAFVWPLVGGIARLGEDCVSSK